jgi:outer membrane protein assembly factor BamB
MSITTASPPAVSQSPRRRFWIPIFAAALPILSFLLLIVADRYEVMLDYMMQLFMAFQLTFMVALLVITIWWFFLSRYRFVTKVVVAVVVVSLPFLAAIPIRNFEFTGKMEPIIDWRYSFDGNGKLWGFLPIRYNPTAQEALDQRLAQGGTTDGPAIDLTIHDGDFPRYRGETGDGVVRGVKFMGMPTVEVWRQAIGGGWSGFVAAGNVLVTLEQRRDNEAVVCYDRDTGHERWTYTYPALFHQIEPMGGDGPRSTPTIHDGDVYTLGATGVLVRLDGKTGKLRWEQPVNVLTDAGAVNVAWGMTGSPLIVGEKVIVNPGINPGANAHKAVAAYDRATGKPVWQKGDHPAGYSSPMLATLCGKEQIVLFDGGGVAGIDIDTGAELWRYRWQTFSDMNIIQPLVLEGDRVFISSEVANGCALVQVKKDGDAWQAETVWRNKEMGSKFSNPVLHQGHIYGMSNGVLTCLDAKTGERKWHEGRYGLGQILLVGDVLLILGENPGDLIAVAADPSGLRELGRRPVFEKKTWNTPAMVGKRLYLRTHKEMVCLELP